VKVLFLTRHFGCLRNFEGPVFELTARGHSVHLVAHQDDILGGQPMVERWAASNPRITWERLPEPAPTEWDDLAVRFRLIVDYLRYLDPQYKTASGLVKRAVIRTPQIVLDATKRPLFRSAVGRRLLRLGLGMLERALPRAAHVDDFLRSKAADVVLLTPLLALGSEEMDYLEAALDLGLPAAFCVWSWDNLSSKALLRSLPHAVLVWNETQKREAVRLHRVPRRRVVVTGAQSFDHWFTWRPERTREAFLAAVGLPPDRPYLLWVCSALLKGSAPEAPFVRQWIERLRASGQPGLRDAAVLIRPHPSRKTEWETVSLEGLGPVSLWGANPVDTDARRDYFESLRYASAVAGLNTSAFLEAAILERPVYTLMLPEHRDNQQGTLHFDYLLREGGGLLQAANGWDEHLAALADALRLPPGTPSERSAAFVRRFIRPLGLDVNATTLFVGQVERLAASHPRRRRPPVWLPLAQRVLGRLKVKAGEPEGRRLLMTPRELEREARIRARRSEKDRLRRAQQMATR
jgi:hypothetical protein